MPSDAVKSNVPSVSRLSLRSPPETLSSAKSLNGGLLIAKPVRLTGASPAANSAGRATLPDQRSEKLLVVSSVRPRNRIRAMR